ncbi:hypothetical protein KI387_001559, partial [Taxus chinensis]
GDREADDSNSHIFIDTPEAPAPTAPTHLTDSAAPHIIPEDEGEDGRWKGFVFTEITGFPSTAILKAVCAEAGWIVDANGTTYRPGMRISEPVDCGPAPENGSLIPWLKGLGSGGNRLATPTVLPPLQCDRRALQCAGHAHLCSLIRTAKLNQ